MASSEQPEITLYWLNSSRAQRIVWLLEELELKYEVVVYHREKSMLAPPELGKIHPLGKSPVVTIKRAGSAKTVVLAESGFIMQYLCDHFGRGKSIVPKRYTEGQEGVVGEETEEWMRYQYFLYYSEGSLMPYMTVAVILSIFRGDRVPLLVRPITSFIAGKVSSTFLFSAMKKHLAFLESQIATSPGGGKYLCGQHLTAADIILRYPLLAARERLSAMVVDGKSVTEAYPLLWAYLDRLEEEPGYKKAVTRIEEVEGKKDKELMG
ncbi:Glutathione S-transferase 1 [Pleurostoma richardsiae]|uniref:glutathione transferase n=1 Tax=Pleurostoma richardsiae TaxID=41990 RepID=A0AA38VGI8_9PEZI|nr:Glutathione S-transferase 1 [Pleurostoma richardsiae]